MQSVTPNAAPRVWGITTQNNINYANAELKDCYVFSIVDVDTDDAQTDVSSVFVENAAGDNQCFYDLSGRKVTKPLKHGVYIKNGKK